MNGTKFECYRQSNMEMVQAELTTTGYKMRFNVWAPLKEKMSLHVVYPEDAMHEMIKSGDGYWTVELDGLPDNVRYYLRPDDGNDLPDPASQYQPDGVHGPSQVVVHSSFDWTDQAWKGVEREHLILYELHVGTFTPEGTIDAIVPRLDDLKKTGINAIELMPVAQFPGGRNWGYDGVFPYAVQNTYGGPDALKRLVNACHRKGIAVFLDVVYNHQGPEGNYLPQFGPYTTDRYKLPWGDAINFDGEWSDGPREFFSNNMIHWFQNYHVDGLRVDAIHTVFDSGAVHFWELCHDKVKEEEARSGRRLHLIAESDFNSPRVVQPPEQGGFGFGAQWLDDFHHALYVLLDEKGKELYEDFGSMEQLAKAYTEGFVHSGEYVRFRKRKHGKSSAGVPGDRFVVFNQNHDQIGNRVRGDRLCSVIDFEKQKLAAAAVLLAPYIPMLFMGEEYSDRSPFYYFVSHSDPALIKAVQEGRKKEFENYKWDTEPPDPQLEKTFEDSKLRWEKRSKGEHNVMLQWFTELISVRKNNAAFLNFDKAGITATIHDKLFVLERKSRDGTQKALCLMNFGDEKVMHDLAANKGNWQKILDSKDEQWSVAADTNTHPDIVAVGETIEVGAHGAVVVRGGLNGEW